MKRKMVTVTPAAIKAMARQNTKASARLEGREVPADFVRSPAVERYIAECGKRTADALVPRRETDRTQVQSGMIQSGTGDPADDLLSLLKTEIWPLLEDRSPITKAERVQMLDGPTTDRDGGHRVNTRRQSAQATGERETDSDSLELPCRAVVRPDRILHR